MLRLKLLGFNLNFLEYFLLVDFTVTNLKSIPTFQIREIIWLEIHMEQSELRVLEAMNMPVFILSYS
jgi:hypothetical protein